MARTYADAIASLNTLQSNFTIIDQIRKSGRQLNENAIPEMVEWCRKIGYRPSDFDALNAIHIAGTKGKGSTAAFTSSILTQFVGRQVEGAKRLTKVGLYTSPHLRLVRERIQINGAPLSEDLFTRYFFEVWDRLEDTARVAGEEPTGPGSKPAYFRFLTLMAFHTYLREKVDVAIIECGIGGAYDSTNVVVSPAVTAITSLGIDHVGMLGSTISEIAWHKAGIMKEGVYCFTPDSQPPDAKKVLEKVAQEKGSMLVYVSDALERGLRLGLQGDFQRINAAIALYLTDAWLRERGYDRDPEYSDMISTGLERVHWPGRCDTRLERGIRWCIDGGHTLESIKLAGEWFATQIITNKPPRDASSQAIHPQPRFLIFNQQTRDAAALAKALFNTLSETLGDPHPFTHVIFCTNTTFEETGFKPDLFLNNANASDVESMTVQHGLAEAWAKVDSSTKIEVVRTIEEAVSRVRQFVESRRLDDDSREQRNEVTALVTGSLHLVGGFLEVLESRPGSRNVASSAC